MILGNEPPQNVFGSHPKGFLILTREGRSFVLTTAENRRKGMGDAERAALHRSMLSYSGEYRVEGNDFITVVDVSWNEEWNGTEQRRHFRIEGDILGRRGASVRMVLQTENSFLETPVRFQGCIGMSCVDFSVQVGKVALSAGSDVNEVCHARLRNRRKTPSPAGPFLFSRPPGLTDAFLHMDVGGNVDQVLVGFGILHDSRCLSLHRKHHRALVLFKLFHEVAGPPPKGAAPPFAMVRETTDVVGN